MVICMEQSVNDLHMVQLMPLPVCHPIISCFIKIQIGLSALVPAYTGCAGKEAVKWVCSIYSYGILHVNVHLSQSY